jgi:hypothetical protein
VAAILTKAIGWRVLYCIWVLFKNATIIITIIYWRPLYFIVRMLLDMILLAILRKVIRSPILVMPIAFIVNVTGREVSFCLI